MTNVRTGKASIGLIEDTIREFDLGYSHNPFRGCKQVVPSEWYADLNEEVAIEIISKDNFESKVVLTRTNGDTHIVNEIGGDYIDMGNELWGELWAYKFKLFSDTDLDGYGCGVVARNFFGKLNVDIEHLRYDTLFERLKEFFGSEEVDNYNRVYMTDLNINEEQYQELRTIAPNFDWDNRFIMVDHHVSSVSMNKHKFAHVIPVFEDGFKPCGTSLFYDYCKRDTAFQVDGWQNLDHFVEQVRQWDVWDWVKADNQTPKKLNMLSEVYSSQEFIDLMIERHNEKDSIITDDEEFYLSMKIREMENYFRRKEKTIIPIEFEGYNVGLSFGEQYRSELGNHLSLTFPQYDFIMLIGMTGGVSLRTAHDHIDLSVICSNHEGGGHPKAGGFSMEHIKEYVADLVKTHQWKG